MILATYQPLKPDPSKTNSGLLSEALRDRMGYNPIWCFGANSLNEFFRNSYLAAPNWPEVVYVFETDDFVPIDVVKWNHFIYKHIGKDVVDHSMLDACFEIDNQIYCEYLVKSIPKNRILCTFNIHDAIFKTKYSVDWDGKISKELSDNTNKLANVAASFVGLTLQNTKITGTGDYFILKKHSELRTEKLAFEIYLAPFIIGPCLPGHSYADGFSFEPTVFFNKLHRISTLCAENYNGSIVPTYARQDEIISLLDSCIIPVAPWGLKEIERNAPCPCGSGLKYKKCCLGKYRTKV